MALLRVIGSIEPRIWLLSERLTTVGSALANDICLLGSDVVEHHATIQLDASAFVLRTTARKHTVMINGKKRREHTLCHGDRLTIGETELEFVLLEAPLNVLAPRGPRGLEHLRTLAARLSGTHSVTGVLEHLLDAVLELSEGQKGFVILARDGRWSVPVARSVDATALENAHLHLSDSIIGHAIASRRPLIIADVRNEDAFEGAQSVVDLELSSVLCLPLFAHGELLGLIYVGDDRPTGYFAEVDLELLQVFASWASLMIASALHADALEHDRNALRGRLRNQRFGSVIGASKAMQAIFEAVERVAPASVSVLITGETGTGKELIAHEIHRRSPRADGPFITINCGAIPEHLLESELFGHVRGAFTGATARRDGKFHAAHRGTLFLDEIGEMPAALQVKLLRVLQEHCVTRVGSNTPEELDFRVLAATHVDLHEAVANRSFREDLYYRLNVVELQLPPLRKRGGDVMLLANFLIERLAPELGVPSRPLSASCREALRRYNWPGNVRQLENRIKRALILASGPALTPADLELEESALPQRRSLAEAKEAFALTYILETLERNGGNRSQTARDLDVDPRTIFRYLEKA
ncbi:GAF domain-containing protein [Bradymonadaceae bacterium TMQ3]|nr:GAF domain-containing protein [Bradymonadaceae bacterium TMQ3]TXC78039.1 GAF domain-containing protein [Bradymonadales bacterium TMQ1]